MQKIDSENSKKLMLLGAAAYFTSYLTRINFGAVIAAIIQSGDIDKATAGAVTTIGFITYGLGQLVSGWLGDRVNPKFLMFFGFIVTAGMNILIPLCPNSSFMIPVWGINGFAQSFMWPPMIKIMKTALDDRGYVKSCVVISWGSTIGTICIYLISPLIIRQLSWKAVFSINGCVAIVMSAVWMLIMTKIEKSADIKYLLIKGKQPKKERTRLSVDLKLLIPVMIAIMAQGSLRDGVTTWVPSYITEVFHFDSSISILTSVIIPLFSLASIQLTSVFYNKTGQKPYKSSVILFTASAFCCLILRIFSNASPILTVVLSALTVACMHGINLILVCFLPGLIAGEEHVSLLSGLLNFTTYVGSAVSTYGFAVLSDKSGWSGTVICWAVVSFVGVLMCIISSKFSIKIKKS
ncbi:MAG: MFS transporter [Ruminococcus sp.]|nr:MFS transporter [Candidatus Copronaster equi]